MQRHPHQSGSRRWQGDDDRTNRFRNRDEDEGRYSSAEDERDYGSYTETDEGDSSVRAGAYDEGRVQYGGRDTREQQGRDWRERGGSSGRYAGYGNFGQGDYSRGRGGESGQGRYGQSGYGPSGYGQGGYGQSQGRGQYRGGNYGEGRTGASRDDDYGYGYGGGGQRGGQASNYRQPDYGTESFGRGRRSFGDSNYDSGAQHRQSAPGGFGHAQGSSAWRGHGVEGDFGNFSSGGWSEPYEEGQPYSSRTQFGGGMGQHRGKGPKGYQRSDDRLKEMICERLRDDPHIDASDVTVTVQSSRVTLEGSVDSRHTKNLIEDVAEQFGVDDVQNNLRVQRWGQGQSQEQGSGRGATGSTNPTGTTGVGKGTAPVTGTEDEQTKQRRN